jgi:hypothetical protein
MLFNNRDPLGCCGTPSMYQGIRRTGIDQRRPLLRVLQKTF